MVLLAFFVNFLSADIKANTEGAEKESHNPF